jgi:hypothetical protein
MTSSKQDNRDIRELEELILRCKERGDPESLWIKSLLEAALAKKRESLRNPLGHSGPGTGEVPQFTHH